MFFFLTEAETRRLVSDTQWPTLDRDFIEFPSISELWQRELHSLRGLQNQQLLESEMVLLRGQNAEQKKRIDDQLFRIQHLESLSSQLNSEKNELQEQCVLAEHRVGTLQQDLEALKQCAVANVAAHATTSSPMSSPVFEAIHARYVCISDSTVHIIPCQTYQIKCVCNIQ
jgi:hypothetical protein